MKILFCDNSLREFLNFRIDVVKSYIERGDDIVIVAPQNSDIPPFLAAVKYYPIELDRGGMNPLKDLKLLLTYTNLVPAETLVERLAYDPTFHIAFLQALFTQAYEHILTDYLHTPEERYRMLIKRFPNITECASLSDIASYLNISYRHLHRIRLSHLK